LGFSRLWDAHPDKCKDRLEELRQNHVATIWVDSRASAFSSLVNHLFCFDESFGDDYDDDYDEDLLAEEYRKEIQKIYLKMKEVLEQK
jgi:hypothetical protein